MSKKKFYYFSKPDCMDKQTHSYSDDVAITKAKNKKEATKKFKILYGYSNIKAYVHKLPLGKKGYHDPFVLTNY